jgi:hypothetical protein
MVHVLHTTDFCQDDTPWCYFVVASLRSADAFAGALAHEQPSGGQSTVVRVIQGRHCSTAQAVFQEWSAALQFPYYFGHNWDAFDECIADFEWLPGSCYVFVVTNVDLVLPHLDRDFGIFVDVLRKAHREWKIPNRYHMDEPTAPFTVVFHAEAEKAVEALARLHAAGVDPVECRFSDEFIERTTLRG